MKAAHAWRNAKIASVTRPWWAERLEALYKKAEERGAMIALGWSLNPLMLPYMEDEEIREALDRFERAIEADDHTMEKIVKSVFPKPDRFERAIEADDPEPPEEKP